jgi:UDP-2,3-diacylglucosamine pyrophosphatase LpxH
MGNRYLVISDLHLADIEDGPDGWKAYKRAQYCFDAELATLVDRFTTEQAGHELWLVLNGDVFDFDVVAAVPDNPPWPVSRSERKRGLEATAAKSVWKLERMLADHPELVTTLARFGGLGHRLVYVLGNHDRELHFPEVQKVFRDALERAAVALGQPFRPERVTFEPWFFYVPGEIYAEHGHQFDYYSSFRYQLWPVVPSRGQVVIALPMGDLSNRYLITRMGYFNPYTTDYILNVFRYAMHWLRYYAFSRRSLVFPWLFGSIAVILRLLRIKRRLRKTPPEHTERMARISQEYPLTAEEVTALGRLHEPPITQKVFRILRELWIDRTLIALGMTGGTIALALVPIPLWIKLMVPLSSFPLLYFIYEWLVRDESIFRIEKEIPERARAVSRLLPIRVVTFGHTHVPRLVPLSREATFVDTGTWAPIPCRSGSDELRPGFRNYLVVSIEHGAAQLTFGSWMSGAAFPCADGADLETPR